jgi:tyrosyl-tRNA synthetase
MGDFFRLVTRWTPPEIEAIETDLSSGKSHPRDVKMKLAREIVAIYYGEDDVESAEEAFKKLFQQQEIPDDMPEFTIQPGSSLVTIMKDAGLVKSNSEARRLVKQKGVRLDDHVVDDADQAIEIKDPIVLRVGKRRFVRLMPKE